MLIREDKKLKEIQAEFSGKFPFLKIEFYTSNGSREGRMPLDPETTVGAVQTVSKEGALSLHGNMKVRTLETAFSELYGLNAQVFRLSGNIWLQTTSTDEWTLHEQNRKGGASLTHYKEKHEL